jgi:putative ABC transport system permease protein
LNALRSDIAHSLRMFRQSPGFTITAIAALTLGIGANTAIFSVVNAVLLKPVPFPEPDRLVMMMNWSPQGSGMAASPAKFQHWRNQATVVEQVSAFRTGIVNYTAGDVAEQLRSAQVSADYFRCFGVSMRLGRAFSKEEDLPNGPKVALITEEFWQRRFARDPQIVGKTLPLSGDPYTVIGVINAGFDISEFGPPPDVFVPFQLDPNTSDQGHYFTAAGRLKAGVTVEQAQARFRLSGEEYKAKFPNGLGPNGSFSVTPFREAFVSNVRPMLLVMLGAVAFVLLIACANVANLLLVRATGRRREIAIRAAIGAGRARIIRQLLTESVILSLAGGVLGMLLGLAGIRALLSVNTANLPRMGVGGSTVDLDWRVVVFTTLIALVTGILFGLIPALQGSRADLNTVLKDSSGRSGTGFRQNKARSILVISEVTLAVILLIGSALLIRTTVALGAVDPGYDTQNLLTMRMSLTGPRYQKAMGVEQAIRDGSERIRAIPGVVNATGTCCVPLQGGYGLPFIISGKPLTGPSHGGASWSTHSEGFFEIYKIPIKKGRSFTARDDASGPPVVIINETFAKRFLKDSDPLNERLIIGRGVMREFKDEPVRQIIGVVGDVRDGALNADPGPHMYVPQGQISDAINALNVNLTPVTWVVRTQGEPMALSGLVREQLRQATGLPVSDVRSMGEIVSRSTARQRFNMLLMTVFGSCAVLLAAIGIYGLMAYSVEQRTQEIGIRLALGAGTGQVKRMVVTQGMRLAIVGVVVGLAAAFGLSRLLESLLYGVKARDPIVFTLVPIGLSLVALLAVWLPAGRASKVNPLDSLRYE